MKTESAIQKACPIACVTAFVLLLGFYAAYLNRLYYSANGPFYDSLSYMNQLARVMGSASTDGFFAALRSSSTHTTVFFPWLEGALLGLFVDPVREHGVLIQLPLVFAQAMSGYYFFKKVPMYSTSLSIAFSLVLVAFQGIFYYNGGLSDLRMDLSQSLAFGASLALFAIAHKCKERRYWIMFGAMLGIACLVRATTPVYAILVFGAAAIIDFFASRSDIGRLKERLSLYLLSAGIALVISIWFFILNFNYLHFYYVDWNFDANAKLPFSKSIGHVVILLSQHIGVAISTFLGGVLLFEFYARLQTNKPIIKQINWIVLIGFGIPLAFLVISGAALNPFVSMVAVPGLIMFFLAPFKSDMPTVHVPSVALLYVAGAFFVCGLTAFHGIDSHKNIASPWNSNIQGLREITSQISTDMQKQGRKIASFEATFIGSLDSQAIMNSFVFDQHFRLDRQGNAEKAGSTVKAISPGLANPNDWNQIAGSKSEDKLQTLIGQALNSADYVIVPEDGTKLIPHHAVSPYAFQFRDLLLASGKLKKIAGPIRISENEVISIYFNRAR